MNEGELNISQKQQLRKARFGFAIITWIIFLAAMAAISSLGFGKVSNLQWSIAIGFSVAGNLIFATLFFTNTNLRFRDPSLTREQILFAAIWGLIPISLMHEARPLLLMLYVPAFSFGMLRMSRPQYFKVVLILMVLYSGLLAVEHYSGRPDFNIQYELVLFFLFGLLITWFSFFGGYVSNIRHRLRLQKEIIQHSNDNLQKEIDEHKLTQDEKDKLIVDLKNALTELKTLSGLLPICASCKKIRDDQGYWNQIELYITDHSEAEFSHGICPDCAKKLYPGFSEAEQ